MNKFYVISNASKDKDLKITKIVEEILKKNNKKYKINATLHNKSKCCYTDKSDIDEDTECIIIIGGDGTLIQAARDLADIDIPIVGVNIGHLGYLTEIEPNSIEELLNKIFVDEYKIESKIMLNGAVYRKKKGNKEDDIEYIDISNREKIYEDIALNDIIIGRYGNLQVIDFKIYVNDEYLNLYSADGVIISTPTGSTAYNLSAGGPILEPGANIMVITPICSHTIGSRSIVLSADSKIKIEICPNRHSEENTKVYFDGNSSDFLETGDIVKISKSDLCTKLMKLNQMSFVELLHKKMEG